MAISQKQKQILAFPYTNYDALICDGAIRSGKTVFMTLAFIDWAMREFNHQQFAICGKTVDATKKNILKPYMALTYAKEKYSLTWHGTDKILIVRRGNVENTFEIFGGKDESSYTLIQGRTLAGVLMDEVALQPRSFVEQALARCSVEGSKMWFNCNPGSPQHWFYKEWILKADEHNAIRLHFQLEDNPALSQKIIERYKSMYTGVFFQRYIMGLWVVAEGLVYDFFGEDQIVDEVPTGGEYYISIDYGTLNAFSAGLWCLLGGKATRVKEWYYSGRETGKQLTDEEYCDAVERLVDTYQVEKDGELQPPPKIKRIVVDPSAASFITALRKRHRFSVIHADNDVMNGIRNTAEYLKNGSVNIARCCTSSIQEFGLYRWDEKASEDKVIKENDHAMDDIRYFCNTIMRKKVGKTITPGSIYY